MPTLRTAWRAVAPYFKATAILLGLSGCVTNGGLPVYAGEGRTLGGELGRVLQDQLEKRGVNLPYGVGSPCRPRTWRCSCRYANCL